MFDKYLASLLGSMIALNGIPQLLHPSIALIITLVLEDYLYLGYLFILLIYFRYLIFEIPIIITQICSVEIELLRIFYICLFILTFDSMAPFVPQINIYSSKLLMSLSITLIFAVYLLLIIINKFMSQVSLFFVVQPFIALYTLYILNYLIVVSPSIILNNAI